MSTSHPVADAPKPDATADSAAQPSPEDASAKQNGKAKSADKSTAEKPNKKADAKVEMPKALPLQVEALLLTTDRPLSAGKLSDLLDKIGAKTITLAVDQLNQTYAKTKRSFRIEKLADGFQIMTLPEFASLLADWHKTKVQTRLTPAAMETLAIIAYKQPILRAEVEAIRGVACGEVLRGLMERHMVKIVGRADEIGRPMLYGTTKQFLETFGLATLKDLPNVEQFKPRQG